jgi:hypothetical protein
MPQAIWHELLDLTGMDDIQVVSANSRQLPPAEFCRAQIWISPRAQDAWTQFLAGALQ